MIEIQPVAEGDVPLASHLIDALPLDLIEVGPRHRKTDPDKVKALAASMSQIGLQQPVTIWYPPDADDHVCLIAGAHRLEAAHLLGWDLIMTARVFLGELDRELWEIDENLCRSELTEAQIRDHLKRRAELWAKKQGGSSGTESPTTSSHPKTGTGVGRGSGGGRPQGFAATAADLTGISKRKINAKLAATEATVVPVAELVGTSLDKGVELDALAKLPAAQQINLAARAQKGEMVSARAPLPTQNPLARFSDDQLINELVARGVLKLPEKTCPPTTPNE